MTTLPPAPLWLIDERDQWVLRHNYAHMEPELYDWKNLGRDRLVLALVRSELVHHLREFVSVRGLRASWREIAVCVGAAGHSSVIDANTRYRHRVLALGVTP